MRPFADKRLLGPFAQNFGQTGLKIVVSVRNSRELPGNREIENILDERYRQARDKGRSEVVATVDDVDRTGPSRKDQPRGVVVDTGVTIMNREQIDAVMDVTEEAFEDMGADIISVAVGT